MALRAFTSRYVQGGSVPSWFPGHMAAAQDPLARLIASADVVLEVRDARIPFTSAHPGLAALCGGKPRVVVLNKADLCAEHLRPRVAAALAAGGLPRCVFATCAAAEGAGQRPSPSLARLLALVDAVPTRAARFRAAGALLAVVGLPNTGKSSLINALRGAAGYRGGARGAAVAPTPGCTRGLSTLRLRTAPSPLYIADTPGVMMPRLADVETGLKLAVTHALRAGAVPPLVQAEYLLYCFHTTGATAAYVRALGLARAYSEEEVEECMRDLAGRVGGACRAGGAVDLEAAALHFVRAFQAGRLGRHTLDLVP
jgi:ribosome biogenesis GTPase A